MSEEGLTRAVLDRARAEAEDAIAGARKHADAVVAAARERADRAAAEAVERARREAEDARARDLSALEREIRLKALEAKNGVIERAFEAAAERFRSSPADELGRMFQAELRDVDLAGATVQVAPGTAGQFEALGARGARIVEDRAIDAGYIVSRNDFRLDCTLAARLAELRSALRGEVAKLIFEENA